MAGIKEDLKSSVVTMVITNGLFVIGKLVGGNKLVDPRVFDMYMEPVFDQAGTQVIDPQTGQQKLEERIRMRPLPGVPAFCVISPEALRYPVVNNIQNLLALYTRVTQPLQPLSPQEEKRIFVPGTEVKPHLN